MTIDMYRIDDSTSLLAAYIIAIIKKGKSCIYDQKNY